MLVSKQSLSAFYPVMEIDLNGYLLTGGTTSAWAGAHLKGLIQTEVDDAVAGRCAVPREVPGAAVARAGDVHTGVINLETKDLEKSIDGSFYESDNPTDHVDPISNIAELSNSLTYSVTPHYVPV